MAVILTVIALYSVKNQGTLMDSYSQELRDDIKQAEKVKKDLENMMEGLVTVGQDIINDIDERRLVNNDETTAEHESQLTTDEQNQEMVAIKANSLKSSDESKAVTDLIKYASNPADEVAEENIGLKMLPDLIDIITEEAREDVLQNVEVYGSLESFNDKEVFEEKAYSNSAPRHAAWAENHDYFLKHSVDDERIRVYQLASELGIETKDIINDVKNHEVSVKHHMNLLTKSEADKIISWFTIKRKDYSGDRLPKKPALLDVSTQPQPLVQKINWEELENSSVSHVNDNEQSADVHSLNEKNVLLFPIKENFLFSNVQMGPKTEEKPSQQELYLSNPYLEVKSLSEQGYSIKEMAQLLKRSQGEIGFMLSINDKHERGVL
ncbi:MAG: translation initiation factor IF-2 N-terminal domain-containing protein [Syntrophomonadaceae bacterium]|jgi:hypothetical protein|nr:translation initiation factor IF-2 N-terminal domain-containing protein [Syntrophomonadaceae bacterium]